ncbi:hypothetical protein [Lachnoclostridium sp. Marseille-P6806]|uniref:hypothetical protein n=1 Tax=Lachnoclostridium sp. Marseille-P6806 TaxID=2364793 RepID=UPI001031C62F|nr:hypothetical protein [Lachnoclostridium sp. Marseille-P6806]
MKHNRFCSFRPAQLLSALFTLFLAVSLAACGGEEPPEDIAAYREAMTGFFDELSACQTEFSSIDVSADDAETRLLAVIGRMDECCRSAAEAEPPAEFENVRNMAKEASSCMEEAKTQFHAAFEGEAYDPEAYDRAMQSYEAAGVRIGYMASLLHGVIPEGVTVIDSEPVSESEAADPGTAPAPG